MNEIFMYTVWSVIGVAAVMTAITLVRLAAGVGPLIARLDAITQWLEAGRPRYDRILADIEAQLAELRGIGATAHRVAGNVESISDGFRSAAQPLIEEVRELSRAAHQARAIAAAVQTGLGALFLHRRAAVRGSDTTFTIDQES